MLFSPTVVVPLMLETYERVKSGSHKNGSDLTPNNFHPWTKQHLIPKLTLSAPLAWM